MSYYGFILGKMYLLAEVGGFPLKNSAKMHNEKIFAV